MVAHPDLKKLQGLFWSSHQRFFKQMLMGAKARRPTSVPAHCAAVAAPACQAARLIRPFPPPPPRAAD